MFSCQAINCRQLNFSGWRFTDLKRSAAACDYTRGSKQVLARNHFKIFF